MRGFAATCMFTALQVVVTNMSKISRWVDPGVDAKGEAPRREKPAPRRRDIEGTRPLPVFEG